MKTLTLCALVATALTGCVITEDKNDPVDSGLDADADGDGWTAGEDCDDDNPEVNPGAVEIYDGVDQDCSGVVDDHLPARGYTDGEEHVGPERWAETWPSCAGEQQSPVALTAADATPGEHPPLELDYANATINVHNNGHTTEWRVDGASAAVLDGRRFDLEPFHFHAGSEHLIDGLRFDLEVHLVHRDDGGNTDPADDALLVVSTLYLLDEADTHNPHFASIHEENFRPDQALNGRSFVYDGF